MKQRLFRFGFLVYWFAFVVLSARQGKFPGLVAHPEQWKYPFAEVAALCALLTVLLGGLYAVLRPTSFPYSWLRLAVAIAYSVGLFLGGIALVATDLPGYYYVLATFGLLTIVSVLALSVASAICSSWKGGAGAA